MDKGLSWYQGGPPGGGSPEGLGQLGPQECSPHPCFTPPVLCISHGGLCRETTSLLGPQEDTEWVGALPPSLSDPSVLRSPARKAQTRCPSPPPPLLGHLPSPVPGPQPLHPMQTSSSATSQRVPLLWGHLWGQGAWPAAHGDGLPGMGTRGRPTSSPGRRQRDAPPPRQPAPGFLAGPQESSEQLRATPRLHYRSVAASFDETFYCQTY